MKMDAFRAHKKVLNWKLAIILWVPYWQLSFNLKIKGNKYFYKNLKTIDLFMLAFGQKIGSGSERWKESAEIVEMKAPKDSPRGLEGRKYESAKK